MKTVRLRDIAAAAHVSCSTVSMALNNSPQISVETKERIRNLAEKMGYHPDLAAQSLVQKKKNFRPYLETLALLEFNRDPDNLQGKPIRQLCNQTGYQLEFFNIGKTEQEQRTLNRVLKARGIRGLLIFAHGEKISNWALDWTSFAAVTFSSSVHEQVIHNVMSSSYQDIYDAMLKIYALGYRRPGYLSIENRFNYWEAGFEFACKNSGIKTFQKMDAAGLSPEQLTQKLRGWIKTEKPDVIVSQHRGLLSILHAPDDIGYFCLDVPPEQPDISGLIQQRDTASQIMLNQLHGMLTRNELGLPEHPFCIHIPSIWNAGLTLQSV